MTEDPFVDPATIPALATILRSGLLAKVRTFELWCPSGDRLLQVLLVQGRPLALSSDSVPTTAMSPTGGRTRLRHRANSRAMWLDLEPETYLRDGDGVRRLGVQCQHARFSVPADWLRAQIAAGAHKRLLDEMTYREMGVSRRGQ